MIRKLCAGCAEKAGDVYYVQCLSVSSQTGKCEHCGKKKRVCGYKVKKK